MSSRPYLRKLALTAHIASSVGWLGAIAGFFVLAVAGLTSQDAQTVQAAYLAMQLIGWFVVVPLSLASLLSGLVQALCTDWGLFRHYWILAKLVIAIIVAALLLLAMPPLSRLATTMPETTVSTADLGGVRIQLVAASAAALLLLLVATVLSVFKPRGRTPYGRRHQYERRVATPS